MATLTSLIRADREYRNFLDALKTTFKTPDGLPIAVNGLSGGAEDAFLVESVKEARKLSSAPVLILVGGEGERTRVLSLLREGGIDALGYKAREFNFHTVGASHDIERERLSVLSEIISGTPEAIVTTPSALCQYTIPEELLRSLSLTLGVGDIITPEQLCDKLYTLGYVRVESVEAVGQYSARGGIVDFFADESVGACRIEFFGDEIDRLCIFDPISQRSEGALDSVSLSPAKEILLSREAKRRLSSHVNSLLSKATEKDAHDRLSRELALISADATLPFSDKYIGVIYEDPDTLISYLSPYKKGVVLNIGTADTREELKGAISGVDDELRAMASVGTIDEGCAKFFLSYPEYEDFLNKNTTVYINPFSGGVGTMKLSGLFGFRCRRTVSYGDNPSMLREDLNNLRRALYRTIIVTDTESGAEALCRALMDDGFAPRPIKGDEIDISTAEGGSIFVTAGRCVGFDLLMPKIAVLSMARDRGREVMKNRRRQRILRKAGGAGQRLMSYADLTVGDYVVHSNYGIALFEGIETVTVDGITKDYIKLRYAGTDRLFVPCDRLECLGKYIGEKDKDGTVKLSKMGGLEWHRATTRAKSSARDIAKSLIALYAERQRRAGFAFPEDSELEYSFADSFEYEETESQTRAISEIKADMIRPVPMNRLLCGDVGYGKTEVALRAAFKAIMGGKQVAFLVPTTILAMQHFQTALSRMRSYPVTVEMLTRFKKPKEQTEILKRVKRGEVDILIGTHKLLSKNLEFRDLGLLIIDEEQRFGVAQKEKLKEIATSVDVLTLTATPIPRTLNMAMNGISDISILDEAPGDRRPVQTYVMEHDDTLVFDAITKELARGGQVLYLYNKVETIAFVADKISRAFPEARVAFAHGQMDKDELEDIWQLLIRGEIDVLVCTTIIETGVDLPGANTLIIENADKFGLSQLHQIRGRVGRAERQAYAYLTYRAGKALSEVARKRLEAIKQYAEFGAGFKIALCDLEIRGAGNLLGAEQHGYIDMIGYDLYVKILNEAVREAKGEVKEKREETLIDIKINAHIPEYYITSTAHRIEMYKKISHIETERDALDVRDEMLDRFGDMPKPVGRLIDVALIKALATEAGISKICDERETLTFFVKTPDLARWSGAFAEFPGMRFAPSGDRVIYKYNSGEVSEITVKILRSYFADDTKESEVKGNEK